MSWIDIAILALVSLSAWVGLFRGLLREVLSLAVLMASLWAGLAYYAELEPLLPARLTSATARTAVALLGIFVVVFMAGAILTWFLTRLSDKAGLAGTDHFLGLFFGAARGFLIVCIVVLLAGLTPLPQTPLWKESQLLPTFQDMSQTLIQWWPSGASQHFKFAS
ncbi:MAG: CvpA family protein [Pseudomonadota bacterium]